MSKIKPIINKYNWNGTKYPWNLDDKKKFETNNVKITLNVLQIKEKEICIAYISKHNSNSEKQIIVLTILNEKRMSLCCSKKSIISVINIK